MKANEAPEKIILSADRETMELHDEWVVNDYTDNIKIEYTRTDAFIDKACKWIRENITNNPNANSVLVRNGCVTLGMLIENFKNYMKGE